VDTREKLTRLHVKTGWDFAVRIETGAHSAWSAEIRVTPDPYREDGPDRSVLIFATGGMSPEAVLAEAYLDLLAWVAELEPEDASRPCRYCEDYG
jgi:hypothetical protein